MQTQTSASKQVVATLSATSFPNRFHLSGYATYQALAIEGRRTFWGVQSQGSNCQQMASADLFIVEVGALAFLTSEVTDCAVFKSDRRSKMLHFVGCGVAAKTAVVDFDKSPAVAR